MESNNPAFNDKTLKKLSDAGALGTTTAMTLNGTINKIGFLIMLTLLSSFYSWTIAESEIAIVLAGASILLNVALAFAMIFKKEYSPYLAPVYAVAEGLALGFISYFADRAYKGVAGNALVATFGIMAVMMVLYRYQILKATPRFVKAMSVAMIGIMIVYIADIVAGFMGHPMAMVHQSGVYGMLFSLFVIGVASLNFILDFDMIEKAVEARAPAYMEWYCGFSVLLTIVWLYLEILRLLGKARD